MKKKLGIRTLAAILAASVVMSASSGTVFAKNGANVSVTGDVSDASSAAETTTRASAKGSVSVEGAALNNVKAPSGLSGEGTTSSPYQVGSLNDLLLMNSYINYDGSSSKHFVLTKNIDLSKAAISGFTDSDGIWSLVSAKPSLSGNGNIRFHLDGNGHKLYGLNVSLPKNALTGAIFGFINTNSGIENLTIENCTVRVNRDTDGAYAVFAVQNCGRIDGITMIDCALDARIGTVTKSSSDSGYVTEVSGSRVGVGHALGVADNAGKVMNFTVTGSDTNRGVFVKGGRRYVGIVAGQNRKTIADASVSGVRILSYGSDDADTSVSGKGITASYVGVVAGRNDGSATISSASVTLKYGADVLFGDPVGGIVGENAGTIKDSMVCGTNATGASVTSASANLYGCGMFGAIAGENSGTIRGCGAYDVGACFAKNDNRNAFGGVAGANSGTVSECAATGSVNVQRAPAAGVGGLVGLVRSGTTLVGNYALVSCAQGANVGALVGKDGTMTHIGQNNYWSSHASGLATPVPNDGAGQNDLTAAKSVIVLTKSTSGVTINASALSCSWPGSKVTAAADFTKDVSVTNPVIRLNKTTTSVTLSCSKEGAVGALTYTVSTSVPAGISGRTVSARVSIPVYVTASEESGAGSSVKNPIVISDAQQMQILQYLPNAHYKLDADITLGSDWTPVDFGGTFNGSGHTLRIEKPLFSSVSGSRNGAVSDSDWKSAGKNLLSGYIYDMTIVPTACVVGGVFGDVKNATLRDVIYTVNDDNDGFVALSSAKSGALIDTLAGNVFLYRCKVSVPIAVTADNADGIGALVGYAAPANLVAEECETSSLISLEKNIANVGGLFGKIDGKAELIGCCATGCVFVPAVVNEVRANIMIGAASAGVTASGCTYAMTIGVSGGSVAKAAAPFTQGITELNAASDAAKQGAEDARSMLGLIDPELIEEEPVNGALVKEGGVYKLRTASDVQEMMSMLNSGTLSDTYHTSTYELQNDINMGGAELRMATTADTAFCGTFRSASGHTYTLSNFTVTNTGSDATDLDTYPEAVYSTATALFCYAADATFQYVAIEDVTVVSDGVGTAVLVGFCDKDGDYDDMGSATDCTFDNVDIANCNVYSAFSVNGTGYGVDNAALAGTLIGAVWSDNGGDNYTIQNITVTDCLVENRNWDSTWAKYSNCVEHTGGGAWSIGGLIGGSRLANGTLCIGDASASSASVSLQHVTVTGYGGIGGVIGMAGISNKVSAATSALGVTLTLAGGLSIDWVEVTGKTSGGTVLRSSVTAGSGSGSGGSCGGILGIDVVSTNSATISHCAVFDTDILSDNDVTGTSLTNFYADCGGIAGHMSGLVEYCDVTDSTVKSTVAGGIVGRSSRKGTNNAGTLLTVNHCNILGNTTVGFVGAASSGNKGEAGGIVASARYASVTINYCGVGSDAKISSKHFLYAGGFLGYASGGSAYSVKIQNSVMAGTVEIPPLTDTEGALSVPDSTVGGVVAYSGMATRADSTGNTVSYMFVDNCVIDGTLKNTGYYVGGVIGTLQSYNNSTNQKVFQVQDCTISATLAATTTYRAKILGYNEGGVTQATNRWSGQNNIKRALKRNVYSSYLQDLDVLGYYTPTTGTTHNGQTVLMGLDNEYLTTASLLSAGGTSAPMVEDVNKPAYEVEIEGTPTTVYGTYYHNGNDAPEVISGTRTYTILVVNTAASSLIDFDDSDGASPNTEKKYGGWVSTDQNGDPVNNKLEVADTTDATTIDLSVKGDATNVGVMAYYTVTGKTDPETGDPMQIPVWIPLTLSNIPAAPIGGTGTQADPYQIPNLETLNSLRTRDLSKYYMLTADIDASGETFVPIPGPFTGTLYGKDANGISHTISGLTVSGAATGLFEETDGATIQDLTISGAQVTGTGLTVVEEDLEADPPVQGSISGQYASALVGKANDTTFKNITVTGSSVGGTSNALPSAYAGAIAAYATDCKAEKITLNNVTVRYAYFTGGVFGHAHYTGTANKECSILGTTVIGVTVASSELDTSTKYDGVNDGKIDAAGGIVAEFAGTIGDNTSGGTTHTTLNKLAANGNDPAVPVSVTGSTAGAVVGITDHTRSGAASPCVISNVTVGSTTIEYAVVNGVTTDTIVPDVVVSSNRALLNKAAAGGILGKICSTDPDGSANTPDTDPAMPVTITGCRLNEGVSVYAKHFAGGVLGHSGAKGANSKITITSCTSFATVSADQSGSAVGAIAGRVFDLANIAFNLCVASGSLTAMTNVGGFIGLVPADYDDVEVPGVFNTTPTLISNSVFSATLSATGQNGQRGVLFGSLPTSVLPTNSTANPFVNVYYSSYQVPADLRTTTGTGSNTRIVLGNLSGENAYISLQNTVIDLMTNFKFTTDGSTYTTQIRVPLAGTVLSPNATGANTISLWTGKTSGDYLSFICPNNVPFVLKTITSDPDLISFDSSTGTLTPNAGANDTGDAIFVYENGLKLKLDLIASDIKGSGTSADPFLIERIGHLNAIKSMPHAYYVLAADIDFASQTTDHGDPLTATEQSWASNWEAWAKDLTRSDTETVTINGDSVTRYQYRFDGSLDGEWYPYNGGNTNNGYNHNESKVQHKIKNLSVTNDGSYTVTANGTTTTVDVGFYGAGLIPIIEAGGSVSNLEFDYCSFSATKASSKMNNVGVLCAVNYGTVSGITVDGAGATSGDPNASVSSVAMNTSGNNEFQSHHVGAVAGISYTILDDCTVRNMTVSSSHCAGGVVGGGKGVTDSTVSNTVVSGREQAGGIAGANLNFTPDSNHETEVPQTGHATTGDLRIDMCDCVYTNDHVKSCTIQSDEAALTSSVGGILGVAESGDQWNDRSVTFQHCTIDCVVNTHKRDETITQTTVKGRITSGSSGDNFAGGILGQVVAYYDGIVVENCATYAGVYAYGRFASNNNYTTAASALIGKVADSTYFKAYGSSLNFRFINNVCGGDLHSAYYAGGVCGYYGNAATANTIPANADFVCGNIISCSFERLGESNTGSTATNGLKANRGFGIVMGACKAESFTSGANALTTVKENYYSSYVSKESDDSIPAFSARGAVTVGSNSAWTGLYDVNHYGEYKSSFLVVNQVYYQPEDTSVWRLRDSTQNNAPKYEDSVTPPAVAAGTGNIYPGHNSTDANDSDTYSMKMQLKFDMGNSTSVDFADPANSLTVYSTGIANADLHILSITEADDVFVDPDNGTDDFYGGSRGTYTDSGVTKNAAQVTVRNDPGLCASRYDLVADLEYGLYVGIAILTDVGTGEIDNPWKIPDGKTFAHFFFSDAQLMKNNQPNRAYLSEYYAQTGDIDWDDVLAALSGDPSAAYRTGEKYGYVDGSGNFVEFQNSPEGYTYLPIGNSTYPFTGGYDGGWNFDETVGRVASTGAGHTISNFRFTDTTGLTDVGIFGNVYETSDTAHHFKNIHIELAETALDSVDYIPAEDSTVAPSSPTNADHAGVFGGVNTGALCGTYNSGTKIDNCSVVYGTVRSDVLDSNVGALIGKMTGSATLQNCFSSCNVRARADSDTSEYARYACGGLVGSQESSATALSEAEDYPCSYINCFTSSDVVGPFYVGAFVGKVGSNTFVDLTNCASTATVTAVHLFTTRAGGNISTEVGPTLVVGRRPSEGLLQNAYIENASATPKYVKANNVYVAGMNTTEYRYRATNGKQCYPTLFGVRGLRDGSGGIYYDSSALGRITVPNGGADPDLIKVNNVLCDGVDIEPITGTSAPYTAMQTADLTAGYAAANPDADPPTPAVGANLGSAFDMSDTSLYPVLQMANRSASDPYFDDFSQLAAMPMFSDDRELNDVTADRTYAGVIYPTRVSKSLGDAVVTIESSKFSVVPNTPAYPATYDYLLEGNDHRTDMDTDLLFNRGAGTDTDTDSANTAEYNRTDTRTDYLILRNTNLSFNPNANAQTLSTTRDQRSPFVRIATGNIHRTMRIGLRASGNTSYVSTERQLRAISHHELTGKFATVYANTLSNTQNIRICADIDFNPDTTKRTAFIPIGMEEDYDGATGGDQDEGTFGFDGGNCEIRNMYIASNQYSGLFSQIKSEASGTVIIQNLVLRNPDVTGTIAVGALAGQINKAGAKITNCSVIGGTVTGVCGNINCAAGGLVGSFASGTTGNAVKAKWASAIGVRIVTTPANSTTPVNAAGLLFGNTSNATIEESYAVGEMNGVNVKSAGGLVGVAAGTTASGVVTSGYVKSVYTNSTNQTANNSAVGGIFGKTTSSSVVNNAITTAYVSGTLYYGGIVGWPSGGSIKNTIFAGSTIGGSGEEVCFVSDQVMPPTIQNVCYDRSLQFSDLEESYNPLTTWQIVSGSGTSSVFTNSSNPASFQYDTTSYRYYPNPIDARGYKGAYGEISNVISDSFKTGLGFALARINTAYGGTGGSVTEYDEISVTSPINPVGSETTNGQPDGNLTGYMTIDAAKSADTVTLEEFTEANAAIASGGTHYLAENGDALVPYIFDENAYTGVRATMNTTTGDPTFTNATLYRFLVVDLCRIAEIDYIVSYDRTAAALDDSNNTDALVLMLKTKQKLTSLYKNSVNTTGSNAPELTFSSSAVTSKFQDSDTSSGSYTVKYRKICVPTDNKIYVGAMLPSQYKVSDIKAYEWNSASSTDDNIVYNTTNIYSNTNGYITVPSTNTTADTKIRIDVTVTADPSWGLRDMIGGIG